MDQAASFYLVFFMQVRVLSGVLRGDGASLSFYMEESMADFDAIIRYENGEMEIDEMFDFFQDLIDTGLAWQLQGSYGRTAQALIDEGYCHA
jgi:hypothetical protein